MRDRYIVGRQPVFDDQVEVVGYEVMIGSTDPDPDPWGSDLLSDARIASDRSRYFGNKLLFVSAHPELMSGEQEPALPPGDMVIEVSSDSAHDPVWLEGCRRLKNDGYAISIDAGSYHEVAESLLELANFVKLEVGFSTRDKLTASVERCTAHGAKAIARKVETTQRLTTYKSFGFDLFEGYLMSRPISVLAEALTPTRLACLRLIEIVNDPETSATEIERIVETEPGLSYRLLHVSSLGSLGGMRRPVESIREAVVLLGRERMYNWLTLMLMADANRGTPEQLNIAMTRARMCKMMSALIDPALGDSGFTAGLISALDLLLGTALSQIVENLAITVPLREAVLAHSGPLGEVLADVLEWEIATQRSELHSGLDPLDVERCYLDAVAWATELCTPLEESSAREDTSVRV